MKSSQLVPSPLIHSHVGWSIRSDPKLQGLNREVCLAAPKGESCQSSQQ